MAKVFRKCLPYVDMSLLCLLFFLLAASLFILSTAAYNLVSGDPYFYVKSHAMWIGTGFLLVFGVACVDYKYIRHVYWGFYGLNVLMLLVVEFMGTAVRGSQRWIEVGNGMSFQPSEFAKIIVVVTLACFLSKRSQNLRRYRDFIIPFLFVVLPMVLVFSQPDLGTSLVFLAIFVGIMFVAGAHPVKFGSLIVGTGSLGAMMLFLRITPAESLPKLLRPLASLPLPLQDYQVNRVLAFLNPERDLMGNGYQVIQSVWAIGSGGLWGKGYHMGTQGQLNFIPDHHTDFIFSVVGEEFGFLGTSILLFLFCLFLLRCVSVAMKSRDLLGTLIVAGLVSMWAFQCFVNVGMATGIMPVTGMPLPFITSGGSSMWANLIGVGLIFSVYARRERTMF